MGRSLALAAWDKALRAVVVLRGDAADLAKHEATMRELVELDAAGRTGAVADRLDELAGDGIVLRGLAVHYRQAATTETLTHTARALIDFLTRERGGS